MSKRFKILTVFGCTALSVALILMLYAFSPISEEIYRGKFVRTFSKSPLEREAILDLSVNSFYIAGADRKQVYLGNLTAPLHLLKMTHHLLDSQHLRLHISLDSIIAINRFRLAVDSPYFYLTHGGMPEYLRGRLGEWNASRFLGDNLDYSVEALPIGTNSLVIRTISNSTNEYELARKDTGGLKFNLEVLRKQIDGIFCLDGKLQYDKETGSVVFIHFYRNEFIVADSLLNVKFRGKTIDQFAKAQIKVSKMRNGGGSMMSAPPMTVNLNVSVDDNLIYIVSNVMSFHEGADDFLTNTVVDVYSLIDGKYKRSFYIPKYLDNKITSFKVVNDMIITIAGNYIITYKAPIDLKPDMG